MKLDQLKHDPRNARSHPERNIATIRASLEEFGAARGIVVDEDGTVLAGNGVLEAARAAGIDDVQVVDVDGSSIVAIRVSHLTADQKARYAVADNRTTDLSTWNIDVLKEFAFEGLDLTTFWSAAELDAILEPVEAPEPPPGKEPDHIPTWSRPEPIVKPGEVWLLGEHRLVCGDVAGDGVLASLMRGTEADMVWTDPPYGVGVGAKNRHLNSIGKGRSNRVTTDLENDDAKPAELEALLRRWFLAIAGVTRPGTVWQVCAPPGPQFLEFGLVLRDLGVWRQTIQWVKNNATFGPMGQDYHYQNEAIFHGWTPDAEPVADLDDDDPTVYDLEHEAILHGWTPGGKHRGPRSRKQTTVWEFDRPAASKDHPTMKPTALIERGVRNHTRVGGVVVDGFVGSGSTIIACETLQRRCYAAELDPHYCDVTIRRWERFTGKVATLEVPGDD